MEKQQILLATGPYIEEKFFTKKEYFIILNKIIKDIQLLEDINLIVKLHPREKHLKEYKKIKGITLISKVNQEEYTFLLKNSSLVITFASTVTLEAKAYGCKTVIIDPFDEKNHFHLLKPHFGTTPVFHWRDNLTITLQRILEQPLNILEHNKDISNIFYKLDGKASERIVNLIYDSIEKNKVGGRENGDLFGKE